MAVIYETITRPSIVGERTFTTRDNTLSHSAMCQKYRTEAAITRLAWANRHPQGCLTCGGTGYTGTSYDHDTGYVDPIECNVCLVNGLCPMCGAESIEANDYEHCDCGWHFELILDSIDFAPLPYACYGCAPEPDWDAIDNDMIDQAYEADMFTYEDPEAEDIYTSYGPDLYDLWVADRERANQRALRSYTG